MCAKHYENPTMLSKVTAKNVGDFFETHCTTLNKKSGVQCFGPPYSLLILPVLVKYSNTL